METIYIPDTEYVLFIKSFSFKQKSLENIEGHWRWIVEINGSKKIVRPESTKPND